MEGLLFTHPAGISYELTFWILTSIFKSRKHGHQEINKRGKKKISSSVAGKTCLHMQGIILGGFSP